MSPSSGVTMAIVESEIWHWTAEGMRRGGVHQGYITVRDAERLLKEAHERGRQQGLTEAVQLTEKAFEVTKR
jgi:hypothetical protein